MQAQKNFEDMTWLFTSDNRNRGVIRQNFDEAALLWRAIRTSKGPLLEIGRRHGGSTVMIMEAAGPDRQVISVDIAPQHHPACQAIFDRILATAPYRLDLLTGDSRRPLPGREYGFLFIDGDHSYDGVKADVIACWNQLTSRYGGPPMAVFHDAQPNDGLSHRNEINHCPGVAQLCDELVAGGYAALIGTAGSMLWVEKLADLPGDF